MAFRLSEGNIERLCGADNLNRGQALVHGGMVSIQRKRSRNGSLNHYQAAVESAGRSYNVDVRLSDSGGLEAECSCLTSLADDSHYCKHIAGALLAIANEMRTLTSNTGEQPQGKVYISSDSDERTVDKLLGLFDSQHASPSGIGSGLLMDTRELLSVEFACQLIPMGNGGHRVGIEFKMGPGRQYVVQKMNLFLIALENGLDYPFAKLFTYDPKRYRFSPEDNAVLHSLLKIMHEEYQYRHTVYRSGYLPISASASDRQMLIPPFAWEQLLSSLLRARRVKVDVLPEHSRRLSQPVSYEGCAVAEPQVKPPLRFMLDRSPEDDGYELTAYGLQKLVVLDAYGMVFSEGRFYRMDKESLAQLLKLKSIVLSASRDAIYAERIQISPGQIESFMERVVPGLMKLGRVQVSESISNRVMYKPLKARMYLDRLRGKLLAGLEFHYGDIVINPLDPTDKPRGADRILMRETEKERAILALMENEQFGKTDGGYIMEGDDAEFHFLHHIVPLLESHLDIYATSAVKLRIASDQPPPKLHIAWEERTDWLHFRFQMDGITEKEIKAVVKAVQEKRQYYKLASGALLPLQTEAFEALLRVMNGVGLHQPLLFNDRFSVPVGRAFSLMDAPLDHPSIKLNRPLRELLDNMKHPDQLDFPVPERMEPVLRDYQRYGYQWMKTLAYYRFGGILADEMGLGKTVQSIAYLLSTAESIRESGRPALIVAPASLMYNWRNELERFAPELRVVVADGSKQERSAAIVETAPAGFELQDGTGAAPDIIITSYPLLRRDRQQYAGRQFHTLILDEAQYFKNDTTQTAGAVRELQAEYRFALTGTPIENRLDELWSIFRVVFPELFPGKKEFGELTREAVAKRSRPFLLRRLKSDVLKELPEKIETIHSSELLTEQKRLYAAYLAKLRQDSLKHLDSDDFGRARIRILAGITRLRQLCCHPALFVEGYEGSSAKFEQLLELIEECRSSGKRALIFSQFTEMLDIIKRELGYRGVSFFYLDGSTPAEERVELCSRFNAGERELFLLSLKAGGTGLNLTGADTVILYDLWWNPAVEQQAADRAHRIGQKNVVQIIRLVAEGTVEDKMYELQQRKKSLIDDVLDSGGEALSALTEQDLREILSLQ